MTIACGVVYHRKPYDRNLSLACPGCSTNECYITNNGINVTDGDGVTVQNGQLTLRSHDWGNYGNVCCGHIGQRQSCYQVCPLLTGELYLATEFFACMHGYK